MRVAIIGNGVAGVTAARAVADINSSIQIVIYSQEQYPYYPRPRLVDLLAGRANVDQMAMYPQDWYDRRGIHARLGLRVTEIRPQAHRLVLEDGTVDQYDRLVLATGARAWVPPIPGSDLDGVHVLRTMSDALSLRARALEAKHAVVLGGGLLGLDSAQALCAHDLGVTTVEAFPRLLPRQLDAEGAAVLQHLVKRLGIKVITEQVCKVIEGPDRAQQVRLQSGRTLAADLVIISTGIRSNISLAVDAGLACNRGIIVDERMRTDAPDIFAVGDAAEFAGIVWGIIPAAIAQARVAGAQIAGNTDKVYEGIVPSTTLQVAGIALTSIGNVNPEGPGYQEIRYSDLEAGVYKKVVIEDGIIVGAIILGDRSDVRAINALIADRTDVSQDAARIFQEDSPLMSLAR